jgi:hypothetical protein
MNHFRRIFAAAATLAGAVLALAAAPAAFAERVPPPVKAAALRPRHQYVSSLKVACPAGRSP